MHYENQVNHRGVGYAASDNKGGQDRGKTSGLRHIEDRGDRSNRHANDLPHRNERERNGKETRDGSRSPYRRGKAEQQSSRRDNATNKASDSVSSRDFPSTKFQHREDQSNSVHGTSSLVEKPKVRCVARHLIYASNANAIRHRFDTSTSAPEADADPTPKLTEDEIIEQRRKKREAIKAKYAASKSPLLVQALEQNALSAPSTPMHDSSGVQSEQASRKDIPCDSDTTIADQSFLAPASIDSPRTPQSPGSPATIAVTNDEELANRQHADSAVDDDEGPSAADYDPNMDMQEDRPDHKVQPLSLIHI